jgi:hypothetical protein
MALMHALRPWALAELDQIQRQIDYAKEQLDNSKREVHMIKAVLALDLDRSQADTHRAQLFRAETIVGRRYTTLRYLHDRHKATLQYYEKITGDSPLFPDSYGRKYREGYEGGVGVGARKRPRPMERQDYEYLR